MGIWPDNDPDLENRDPNNLNDHVKVSFEDIIGEPEEAHSAECVFKCSYQCFEGGKNLCYMLLTILCAIPVSLCWSCEFACTAFNHIWCLAPWLRQLEMECFLGQKFFMMCLDSTCGPLCETIGLLFSKIKVVNKAG